MFRRKPNRPEPNIAETVYRRLDTLGDAEAVEYADLMISQVGQALTRVRHGDHAARADMAQFGDVLYALLHKIAEK